MTEQKLYRLELERPHTIYKNVAGKRVAGTTTILGVLGKDNLLPWYAKMEREGILAHFESGKGADSLPEQWYGVTHRDKAADLGTVTHARCEAFLKGWTLDESNLAPELVQQSIHGAQRFMEWWQAGGFEMLWSEVPLVSEAHQYGGTLDCIARDRAGRVFLIDFKTTNPNRLWPYASVWGQVSAYRQLAQEMLRVNIDECVVWRIGKTAKDQGEMFTMDAGKLDAAFGLFRAARVVYEAEKLLARKSVPASA